MDCSVKRNQLIDIDTLFFTIKSTLLFCRYSSIYNEVRNLLTIFQQTG